MTSAFERIAPLAALIAHETRLDRPRHATFRGAALPLGRGGHQWLPVSAHIRERYLVTYRAPAARLAALVPAPLTIDALDGWGFVSVCALDVASMGIAGAPSFLRWSHRELLYRVGVRAGGEPTFFTLRSDVSSPALALLGRFSHYRLRLAEVEARGAGGALRLVCTSRDGQADADFEAAARTDAPPPDSLFADADTATRFLLGMRFSADVTPEGRVRVQDIDHDPWRARFVTPTRRRFDFLARVGRAIGADLEYDNTLAMTDLRQTWRAARWL
jgi:Uncharacterized conserved protein (COG2071)